MTVTFPATQTWDKERNAVIFPADSDHGRVHCAIARGTLENEFGIDPKIEVLEGFRGHRGKIERVAERLIRRRRLEKDGSVLIRAEDCRDDAN
jgi:hypothetical protein